MRDKINVSIERAAMQSKLSKINLAGTSPPPNQYIIDDPDPDTTTIIFNNDLLNRNVKLPTLEFNRYYRGDPLLHSKNVHKSNSPKLNLRYLHTHT